MAERPYTPIVPGARYGCPIAAAPVYGFPVRVPGFPVARVPSLFVKCYSISQSEKQPRPVKACTFRGCTAPAGGGLLIIICYDIIHMNL